MNEAPLLRVDKLEVVYHRTITAVQGISLTAEAGKIVAILGTNGAGKSTTLRAISGFLGIDDARITDGSVAFKGQRIENRPPNEIARLGVVLVPERDKVFSEPHGGRESGRAVRAVGARTKRQRGVRLSGIPAPRRSAPPDRRSSFRRRAADAGTG